MILPPSISFALPPLDVVNNGDTVFVAQVPTAASSPSTPLHPEYQFSYVDWYKWRVCYEGGRLFVDSYLHQFSNREDADSFHFRRRVTPIPQFASAEINEIKNSLFAATRNIIRQDGPDSYLQASAGNNSGVDLSGSTMNRFLGTSIIPELLVMARVGVFIDAPSSSTTLSITEATDRHPYLYSYRREDILNWYPNLYAPTVLLLRDTVEQLDPKYNLPVSTSDRFRLLYRNKNGSISVLLFDNKGIITEAEIALPSIPFVCFQISGSLMAPIANHQIALLNLESSDMAYALRANFPIYTEQRDTGYDATQIAAANLPDDVKEMIASDPNFTNAPEATTRIGTANGRYYGKGLERPAYIAPPSEPIKSSMSKQEQLKADIKTLLNRTLSSIKSVSTPDDQQEGGLAQIGIELEHGERRIAQIWAQYEGQPVPTTVTYPLTYSIQSTADRLTEADLYQQKLAAVPSQTYRRSVQKRIARLVIGSDISTERLNQILDEIDSSEVPTVDPVALLADLKEGLVSKELVSKARGYPDDQIKIAHDEYVQRLKDILASQTNPANRAAARGIPDLSPNPAADITQEKTNVPVRGPSNPVPTE